MKKSIWSPVLGALGFIVFGFVVGATFVWLDSIDNSTEVLTVRADNLQEKVNQLELQLAQIRTQYVTDKDLQHTVAGLSNASKPDVELSNRVDQTETNITYLRALVGNFIYSTYAKMRSAVILLSEGQTDLARILTYEAMAETIGRQADGCQPKEVAIFRSEVPEELDVFLVDGSPYVLVGRDDQIGRLDIRVEAFACIPR